MAGAPKPPSGECRLFEGVSDSRHPGPGARWAARTGKNARQNSATSWDTSWDTSWLPGLPVGLARNGGQGSIEETEIFHLRSGPEGFGHFFFHPSFGAEAHAARLITVGLQPFGRPLSSLNPTLWPLGRSLVGCAQPRKGRRRRRGEEEPPLGKKKLIWGRRTSPGEEENRIHTLLGSSPPRKLPSNGPKAAANVNGALMTF